MPKFLFFPYFGPNRRSDKRVVELRLEFESEKDEEFPPQLADIKLKLVEAGVLAPEEAFPEKPLPDNRMVRYSLLLAQTALLFQRKCGHRVNFYSVLSEPHQNRCIALIEYQHSDVGMTAVNLAAGLFSGQQQSLLEAFQQFSSFARERIQTAETTAIISAAALREIPCFQLEQEPFAGKFNFPHRIRRNGLLMLGHGAASHILDGTFCVNRAGDYSKALLRNPDQRAVLLKQSGIPGLLTGGLVPKESGVFYLLIINAQLKAISILPDGEKQLVDDIHPSIIDTAMAISERLEFVPVAIKLETPDITRPLTQTGGLILDFDLAPDLDMLLGKTKDLLVSAATDLVDWLIPDSASATMPIIAITGTNGKTTSSRMVSHILHESGRKPGLVCTDGIFLDGKQVSHDDAGAFIGHARALTSPQVDVAVLETHHRGIAVRGFAFEHCHVAVCLNVTAEHLAKGEIETLEEMAGVKCALLERASHAAVLNADDSNCVNMLKYLDAERICLVSLHSGIEQLRKLVTSDNAMFCVLENIEGHQWLIIYDRDERSGLIRVDQIPATFGGTASFNVSNAMHAAAATYLVGTSIEHIRTALAGFHAGHEMTPGRMNEFYGLPFRLIIDFAHNPDGMKKIGEFADKQKISGRKLIAIPGATARSDLANDLCAQAVAGHFDYYFCKDYDPVRPPLPRFMGPFIRKALIKAGVPEHQTQVVTFGRDVIFSILDTCKPGDLLIILAGHLEKNTIPTYIEEYTQA